MYSIIKYRQKIGSMDSLYRLMGSNCPCVKLCEFPARRVPHVRQFFRNPFTCSEWVFFFFYVKFFSNTFFVTEMFRISYWKFRIEKKKKKTFTFLFILGLFTPFIYSVYGPERADPKVSQKSGVARVYYNLLLRAWSPECTEKVFTVTYHRIDEKLPNVECPRGDDIWLKLYVLSSDNDNYT